MQFHQGQDAYCNEPMTQDLVLGLREIPFSISIREAKNDSQFMKFVFDNLSLVDSLYQTFFNSNCHEEFLSKLHSLSIKDWKIISMYICVCEVIRGLMLLPQFSRIQHYHSQKTTIQ